MGEEISILTTVCQKLDEAEIPYMLTGSLAANIYAVPRMTRDIPKQLEKSVFDCAGIPEFPSAKIGLTRGKGQFLHRLRLMKITGPGFVKNRLLKLFGYI